MKATFAVLFLLLQFYFLACWVNPAYAYLDPGIGSMILQALIAGIAAIGLSFKNVRNRLKSFLSRSSDKKDNNGKESDAG